MILKPDLGSRQPFLVLVGRQRNLAQSPTFLRYELYMVLKVPVAL